MPDAPLLVGLDIGSTRVRALAFESDGTLVAEGSVPTPTGYPKPGWAYHEPEALWGAVTAALRETVGRLEDQGDDPARIGGIAAASVGESAVPLDRNGAPTYHAIAWFDQRTQAQLDWLERAIGRDQLAELTGLNPEPISGLCKLLWLKEHEPEAFGRTVRWLHLADYIAYRLSGVAATDYSLASRTLALDLRGLRWADELLREVGVAPGLFAPLTPSGTGLGRVTPAAARETGLATDVRVAVGGHDHICGAFAVGAMVPGTMLDSVGTAEAVLLALDRPVGDPAATRLGYHQGVLTLDQPIYYITGVIYTAGASIEWFREAIGAEASHEALSAEAAAAPAGSLGACFLPHLRLSASPHPDARARGAFIGLSPEAGRGVLFRAVLEGLAYEARLIRDALLAFPEIPMPERIRVIGGNARNTLFMRIKASAFDRALTIAEVTEATSLGAALMAGLGAGVFANAQEARASVRMTEHEVEPVVEWIDTYEAGFQQVYKQAYPVLRGLHHAIHRLQNPQEA